ncbi:SAF domain-containing protein [Salinibacillus xinjiangensis]|uniref:Flp pilus assembly protein CpaB n=1 Tax=Salinibacillus xinjiangensis TaxID=1229268 RepID=A0A6G1X8T0_9BACI|nr:SAF domain-containing protein [Salinibacillus xinjiangensis]MRG87374.1 flp pilus assembly protein CpaB [Salinibacillus xinjiangensis]
MIESKKRALIFLLLAFILASIVGYLVYEKVKSLNAELGGMTEVYIANDDIAARTVIDDSQISVMEIPNKFVTDSHITDKSTLRNRVSVVPLEGGDLITKNMIKPVSNLSDSNNRLVSVPRTERVSFDQTLVALDRVDIIVSKERNGEKITEIFMRDVPVVHAQGSGENFAGIGIELSVEKAREFIHEQHYADHIRILKANVGREDAPSQNADENSNEEE